MVNTDQRQFLDLYWHNTDSSTCQLSRLKLAKETAISDTHK